MPADVPGSPHDPHGDGDAPSLAFCAQLGLAALTDPATLRASDAERLARWLRLPDAVLEAHGLSLSALVATLGMVAYGRSDLVTATMVAALSARITAPGSARADQADAARVKAATLLGLLTGTLAADHAVPALLAALAAPDAPEAVYEALMQGLNVAAIWAPAMLDLEALAALAESAHLAAHCGELLHVGLERVILGDPARVTVQLLDRLAAVYQEHPSWPYLLAYLAERPTASAAVRAVAAAGVEDDFPLRARVRRTLGRPGARALLIQNTADGQGDELIRVVPPLQALLDLNPTLQTTIVTNRAYLYAHPRVTIVSLTDRDGVARVLDGEFDIIVEHAGTLAPEATYDPGLPARIDAYVAERRPFAYVACRNGTSAFTFERFEIEGRDYAGALGLQGQRVSNVYETTCRLLAHLGLPIRLGEQRPMSEPVVAGLPDPAADAAWAALTAANHERRPVALVNPFGEANAAKGYVPETFEVLVERLRRLIAEGYFLVVLPNGERWGTESIARQVVDRLAPADRAYVAIRPDPDPGLPADAPIQDARGNVWPLRELRMRHVISFVGRADLVVAVEGWMIHAASLLGQPLRILKPSASDVESWHPYGRTLRQEAELGPVQPLAAPTPSDSVDAAWSPTPDQPWKGLLAHVLRGIADLGDPSLTALFGHDILPVLRATIPTGQPPPVTDRVEPERTSGGRLRDEKVLILTPLKDAAPFLDGYCALLQQLTYPHDRISIGLLEGDSTDGTYARIEERLPRLRAAFRRVGLWKHDVGFTVPPGLHRGAEPVQIERRTALAKCRNHLLFHALDDEAWVLWLDVDVVEYPPDLIERLLDAGKPIVQPHCVLEYGGPTFDTNGWRDHGRLHLDDLRHEGEVVALDAVGATVLLVSADLHRDGLIFPAFLYGRESPWIRPGRGEVETEGLGVMARDMGYQAWGLPHLEVRHARH